MNKIVILLMIGSIFVLLTLMKVYVYRRFLRHSFVFRHCRWLAIALLAVIALGEMSLFIVRDRHFSEMQYMLVGLCVVVDYCLFLSVLTKDIIKLLMRFVKKAQNKTMKSPHFLANNTDSQISTFNESFNKPFNEPAANSQTPASNATALDSKKSLKARKGADSILGAKHIATNSASSLGENIAPESAPALNANDLAQANADSCVNSQRRRFLKILVDLGIIALFLFLSIKSVKSAISIPPVRQVKIAIPKLKTRKKIALISDVHIGKTLGKDFMRGVVEKINALKADVVVIVGDLIDDKIDLVKEDLLPLNNLQSAEGTYYVAGNHEYYHGISECLDFLSTMKLHILHNKNIELDGFNLAGVGDLAGKAFNFMGGNLSKEAMKYYEPNLEMAKSGLNPQKPSILLAHQPKFVRQNDVSDFELVLCGHTHAGQVFPLSFFVWLEQHYIHGLYQISDKTQLYVSSGAGFWGPAIRFLAPSEIVCIELEPA